MPKKSFSARKKLTRQEQRDLDVEISFLEGIVRRDSDYVEALQILGDAYTRRFRDAYAEAARETGATLIPFFLDGIAGVDSLNQPDGIHPNARGADRAAANAWMTLSEVLRKLP